VKSITRHHQRMATPGGNKGGQIISPTMSLQSEDHTERMEIYLPEPAPNKSFSFINISGWRSEWPVPSLFYCGYSWN